MRKVSRKARTQYDITVKLYEIRNCNSSGMHSNGYINTAGITSFGKLFQKSTARLAKAHVNITWTKHAACLLITLSREGERTTAMGLSVCPSTCPRNQTSKFPQIFDARFLRPWRDMLRDSGFMVGVMFAHGRPGNRNSNRESTRTVTHQGRCTYQIHKQSFATSSHTVSFMKWNMR